MTKPNWMIYGANGYTGRLIAAEATVVRQLSGMSAMLNCAGPFSKTAPLLMEACLRAQAHYLDITGEFDVIETAASLDGRAREAGIAVIPAVGLPDTVMARTPAAGNL